MPVIVSQGKSNNNQLVTTQGFLIYSSDSAGKCYAEDPKILKYYPSQPLTFNTHITVSCAVQFSTVADFKTYCEASPTRDYQMFS